MKEIKELIEKYNNEAIGYEVAFLNSNGTISLYDEDDFYMGDYTKEQFLVFMGVYYSNE